ncbi:MAG: glycosyltransferase family 2 protein [Terriglobales bacterium]
MSAAAARALISPCPAPPAPEPSPTLTVIIATRERPLLLLQTVENLLAQSVLPQQIIIVDQSRDPDARSAVVARAARRPMLGLSYIHAPQIPGAAAARNYAMAFALGAVWLFLDDDVRLELDFIAALLAAYRREPQATGISGIITNYTPARWSVRLWSQTFWRGPFADDRQPIYWRAGALRSSAPQAVSRLGGGLMSFRASAVRGLRFDPRLTGRALAEDVDFCFRLPPGSTLWIAPAARLEHIGARHCHSAPHALAEAAQAAWYLHRSHPNRHPRQRWLFVWLNAGLVLAAIAACLHRRSTAPWRALAQGIATARALHRRKRGPVPRRPYRRNLDTP